MADLSYLYSGIKEEPYSPIVGLNDITWLTPEMQRLIDELNKPKEQQPVPPTPPPPPVTTQQPIPTNTSRLLQYVSTNPPVTPTNNNFSPTAKGMVAPVSSTQTIDYANTPMPITQYSPPYEPAPPPKQQTQQPILAGTPLLKINPEDLKNLDYKVLQNFYPTAPKSSIDVAPPIQEVWKQPIELTPDEKKQVEQFKNIDNISFYNEYQYIEPNISKNIAETLFQQDRLRQETDDFNIKNQNAVRYMRAYFDGDMSKNVLATELPELRRYIYNKDDGQLKFIYDYWKGMYQPLSVDVVNRLQNKIDKKIVPDNAYDLGIATRYGRIILDDENIYRIYNGEVMPFPVATVNQKGKIVPIKYDLTGAVELDDVLSFASEKDRKYLEQKFPPNIMSQSRPTAAELGAALYNDPVYKRIANNPEFLYTMYKRKQTEAEQAGPIKSALAGFGESLAEIPRQALNLLRGEENKVETLPVEYKEPLAYEVGSLAGSFIPAIGLGGAAGGAAKLASSALKLGKIPSRIITIGSTATGIGTEHNLTVLNKYQRGDLTAGQAAESIAINTAMNIGGIATGTAIGIPVSKGIEATGKLSIPKFIRASLLSGVDNAGWTFVSGKIDQKPEFFLAPLAQAPTTSKEKKFTITPEEAHNLGLSFMVGLVFPIFDVAYGKQARREYELKQGLKISPEAQATADRVIKTIVQEPEVKTAIENDDQVALNRAAEKVAPQVAEQENISPQTANNLIKTLIDPDQGASQIIATLAKTKDTKEANEYFKNITNIDNFFADKESQRLQGAVHKVFETHKINPENIQNVQAVTGEGKKKGYIIYTDDGDAKTLHYISEGKQGHTASLSNKEAPVDMYRNELGILNEYLTRQKQKGILPNDLDIYINTETKVPTLHQGEMTQPGFKKYSQTITGDIPNEIKYEPTREEIPTITEPKPEQLPEQIIEPPKTEPEKTETATAPKEAIPPTEETIQPETVAGETAEPIKETQQPEQTEITPARPVEPEITAKPTQTENVPIEQTKPTEIPPEQTEMPPVKEEATKPIETTKTEEIPPQTEVKPAKNTIEPTKVEEPIKTIPEQPVIKGEETAKAEPEVVEPDKLISKIKTLKDIEANYSDKIFSEWEYGIDNEGLYYLFEKDKPRFREEAAKTYEKVLKDPRMLTREKTYELFQKVTGRSLEDVKEIVDTDLSGLYHKVYTGELDEHNRPVEKYFVDNYKLNHLSKYWDNIDQNIKYRKASEERAKRGLPNKEIYEMTGKELDEYLDKYDKQRKEDRYNELKVTKEDITTKTGDIKTYYSTSSDKDSPNFDITTKGKRKITYDVSYQPPGYGFWTPRESFASSNINEIIDWMNQKIKKYVESYTYNPEKIGKYYFNPEDEHKKYVKYALEEGEKVPDVVLKEYPDLQQIKNQKIVTPVKETPEQPVIKGEEPVKAEPVKAEPIKPEPAKVKEEPTTQTKQTVKVAATSAEQPTTKSVVKNKEKPQKELKKKSIPSPTKILEQRTTEKITKQVEQDAKNIEATGSVNKSGHTQFAKLQDEYVAKQTKNISNKVARNKFLYENKVDASNLSDYTKNITEYITPKTYAKAFNEAKTVADVVKFLKDRNINIKLTPNEHTIFNTHEQIKTNYPTAILNDIIPFEDGPIKGVLYKYDNINIVARYTPDGKITIQDMPKITPPETIETPPPKQQKKRTATNKQLENDILTRQTLQAGLKDIDGTVKQSKEFKYNQKIINKISNLIDNDKNSPVYLTKISEGTERGYLTLDWGGEDNLHNALTLLGLSDQEAQDFIKLNHLGKYQHLENGTVTFKPLQNDLSINSDENTLYMSLIPGLEKLPGAIHNLFKRAFDQYDEKAMGNLYKNRGLPDAYSTEFARKDINIPMAKEDILARMQDYPELQALYNERPKKPYYNYIAVVGYLDRIKETNPSKLSEATANAVMYLRQNETKQLWGAPIVQLVGDAVTRLRRLMIKDGIMPVSRKDQEWKKEIFNPFIKKLKGADKEIKEMGIKAPNSMAYYIGEIGDRVFRDLEDAWRAADEYPKKNRDLERQNIRTNNLKGDYLKDDLIIEYAHKVFKQEAPDLSKLLSESKKFQQQVIDLYKNKIDAEQWLTDYATLNNIPSNIIDVNRHTVADLPAIKERYEKLINNREQTNELLTFQLKNLEEDNVAAKGFRDQIKQNEALIAQYEEYVDLLDKAIKFKDHSILIQHSTRDWDMKYKAPYGLSIYEVNKNFERIPTYKQTEQFDYMLYYDSEKKVNNFMQYGIDIGGRHLKLPSKDLKYPANIFVDEAGKLYKVQTFKYEFKTNLALTEAKEIVASILKTSNIAENLNANKAKIVGKISEYKTYLEGLADEGMLDSSAMEYFDDVDDMLNSLSHSQAEAELEKVLRRMLTKLENPSLFQLTTHNSFGYHPDDLLRYTGKKVNKDSYYFDAMNKNKESLQKSELKTRFRNILLDELMTLNDMGISGRYPRLVQDLHDRMLNINVSTVKQNVDAFNNSKIGVMGRAAEQLGVGALYFTNAVLATKNRLNGAITNSTYLMSQLAALNKMYDQAKGTTVAKTYAQAEALSQMELFKEYFANASPYSDPFLNDIHHAIFDRNVIQSVIVEGVTSQFGKSLRKIVDIGYSPMKHTEFMNRYPSLMMQTALDAPTYKDLIANGKITEEAAIDEVLARGLDVSFMTQGIYEKEWRSGIERWLIDHVPLGKWFITMKSPFINQLYYIGNYIADLTIRAGASQQKKMAVAGLGAFAIASTLLVGYSNMPGTEDAKMLIEDLVQMSNQDKNFKIDVWMEEQAVQYLMNLGASEKNARKFYSALYDGVLGTFTDIRFRQLGDMSGLLDAFIVDITRDMIRNAKTQSKEDFIRSTFRKRLPQIYNLAHGYNALTSGILTDRNGMPLRDVSTLEAIKLMIFGESNLDVHTGLEIYNKSNMTPTDRIEDITKFETLNLKRNEKDNLTDAINRLDQSQKDKIDEIYRNYYGLGKPRKTKKYKEMLKVGKDYIDDLLQDENIRNLIIQFDPQVDRYYGRNTEAERNLNALEQAAARYVSSLQRADMTNDILHNVLRQSDRVKSIYADDKYKGRSIEDYPEEEQIKRFLDLYIENKKKAQK
jgi:hypothetical protein